MEGPDGLMLHGKRALGLVLGTLPDLERRIAALEAGGRKGR